MNWSVEFLKEALDDLKSLDHSLQIQVLKGIKKVSQNPLPVSQGGYGKPLGNRENINLSNLLKIKFRDIGVRVVYKVETNNSIMKIIIISARADNHVYKQAERRRSKYLL